MTRAKKILLGLFAFFCILLVALYLGGNYLLGSYSQQFLEALAKRGKNRGVAITEPQFRSAAITGFRSAKWQGLYAELRFPGSESFDEKKSFETRVGRIDGWLAGEDTVLLVARDVEIEITLPASPDDQQQNSSTSRERVTANRLQCDFPLQLTNPLPGLQGALVQITQLVREGSTTMPILASGMLEFELKKSPVQVGLKVEQSADKSDKEYKLVLSAMDLRAISGKFEEPLTDAEVELLANNPLRAAQLLRIKDDAESTAAAAHTADETVPQDAYRHVLWSFLLTNKYGAQFAEEVTDSHEEGDTGNTAAEREMDYHNNEVGRNYADRKVRRPDILSELLTDSSVMLAPE